MSDPKNQHSVPQFLLERFADNDGYLHVFDKRHRNSGIWKRKPRGVFVEKDLYTQIESDRTKDASVEKEFLSTIEARASPVVEKIVCTARRADPLSLTPEEKDIWLRFLYCQFIRVPETRDKHTGDIRREVLNEISILGQLGLFHDYELSILHDKRTMERLWRNASIRSVTTMHGEWFDVLSKKRLWVAVVRNPKPKRGFVIGSNPVLKLTYPGRAHLADPSVELWLALARDVAVTPCPGESDKIISIRDNHVASINRKVFEQSDAIAGCSRKLIHSVLEKEE